ncbi:hypothetical protein SEVIR_7G188901v4 [Setaria viridis]
MLLAVLGRTFFRTELWSNWELNYQRPDWEQRDQSKLPLAAHRRRIH